MRPPPGDIQILLPVWGERYTRDFLELSLPSLMAPGNLPALSKLGRCTFVLLAPVGDADVIGKSPLWALLRACCAVRVQYIDNLISQSSSTVLTLAYAWAIREVGRQALDTCFVLLVADYVVSDGSLLAVVERIFSGANGVLAGNFQVTREVALPSLEKRKNDAGVLAVPSRTLVEISLKALHRTTLTDIVHEGRSLKAETNRLFWRVDDHCMVGRFFLMHMIAIRPEISDFIIAAPSDYSFIPELCPSANITHMTDSDDYFVVECQPQDCTLQTTAAGRIEPRSVAKALASWATTSHRDNARHALVFHADGPSPQVADAIAASEIFVSEVRADSAALPMPFRHHPLWARALDYHLTTARMEQDLTRLAAITGDRSLERGLGAAALLRSILLGRAPYFRPWHPRWPDVRALVQSLAATSGNVAIVSDAPARVRVWLDAAADGQGRRTITHLRPENFRAEIGARVEQSGNRFDVFFLIADQVPADLGEAVPWITTTVKPGGVVVLAIGRLFSEADVMFVVAPSELVPTDGSLTLEKTTFVTKGAWRTAVQTAMMHYARGCVRPLSLRVACWFAAAGGLAAISIFFNIVAARERWPAQRSRFSSLFFTFRNAES